MLIYTPHILNDYNLSSVGCLKNVSVYVVISKILEIGFSELLILVQRIFILMAWEKIKFVFWYVKMLPSCQLFIKKQNEIGGNPVGVG